MKGSRAEKPLPCPFCGRTPKVVREPGRVWVECVGCYESSRPCGGSPMTDIFKTAADAIAAWNYRPEVKP